MAEALHSNKQKLEKIWPQKISVTWKVISIENLHNTNNNNNQKCTSENTSQLITNQKMSLICNFYYSGVKNKKSCISRILRSQFTYEISRLEFLLGIRNEGKVSCY